MNGKIIEGYLDARFSHNTYNGAGQMTGTVYICRVRYTDGSTAVISEWQPLRTKNPPDDTDGEVTP